MLQTIDRIKHELQGLVTKEGKLTVLDGLANRGFLEAVEGTLVKARPIGSPITVKVKIRIEDSPHVIPDTTLDKLYEDEELQRLLPEANAFTFGQGLEIERKDVYTRYLAVPVQPYRIE